jgi:hypothetical protein
MLFEKQKYRLREAARKHVRARQVAKRLRTLGPRLLERLKRAFARDHAMSASKTKVRALSSDEYRLHLKDLCAARKQAHAFRVEFETTRMRLHYLRIRKFSNKY